MFLLSKVKKKIVTEAVERLPWALMAYIAGILSVIYVDINPSVLVGLVIGCGIISFMLYQRVYISWIALLAFCFFLGVGNINLRIYLSHHPVLEHPLYQTRITATIEESHLLADKQILTLYNIHWESPDLKMPRKVRVHFRDVGPVLKTGDKIKASVSVYPIDKAFSPSYVYQLWFDEIGATGFVNEIKVLSSTSKTALLFKVRNIINQHLFQILPRLQAEIAASLITGEQKFVSKDSYQIYRRAGIAHVLSVSGFHMALLAGFLFFVIRGICGLIPCIALYCNTKKIAAVIALVGTFLYLELSGFQVPAIRAFMMISLVFIGILVERSVLSMRSLMLVGFGLLLMAPQMVFSISFQLSFMAVAVLVTVCQYLENRPWNRLIKIVVGFLMLNVFVSMALMPFIFYHFHQFLPYSIFGNMLFSGAFSFFIMPLLFMGTLLIPSGIDVPIFYLAGLGLDWVRSGAEKLASLPNAEIRVDHCSSVALGILSFGMLMICLMRTPLRWLGGLLIFAGILLGILS